MIKSKTRVRNEGWWESGVGYEVSAIRLCKSIELYVRYYCSIYVLNQGQSSERGKLQVTA